MGCKLSGRNTAVGYWGRNIHKRIDSEFIPQKIRVLLGDKLLSRGKSVNLWQQIDDSYPNSIECSCIKNTSKSPDTTCSSCYGTKLIPGYVRFGHETLFLSSIGQYTAIGVYLDKDIKPNRVVLYDNILSGSITSSRILYKNLYGVDWDYRIDAANIKSTNLITISFSTDGICFFPIEDINENDKKPIGIGSMYLRVSLARANVEDRSPEFEVLRLRHINKPDNYIKILRPQVTELPMLMQYGIRAENVGERFWTMPLDFFDSSIPANTPLARIRENAFYQRVDGINVDSKFVTTKLSYNEEFGILSHQSFEPRKVQTEEAFAHLVF